MKNISILVLETSVPQAIVDPRYMFNAVNEFYKSAGHQPFFNVKLVGNAKEVKLNEGAITVHPDLFLKDVKKTDLIIIPAISGNVKDALKKNAVFIPWIIDQH